MNDDQYGELQSWIEPEIEARLVALVLGEASDFEADELERLMDERPELRVFRKRIEAVQRLLRGAVKPEEDEQWRLSGERREALLKKLGVESAPERDVVPLPIGEAGREQRIRRQATRVAIMVAACLMLSLLLVPFIFKPLGRSSMAEERSLAREKELDFYLSANDDQQAEGTVAFESAGSESRSSRSDAGLDIAGGSPFSRERATASESLSRLRASLGTAVVPEEPTAAEESRQWYGQMDDKLAAGIDAPPAPAAKPASRPMAPPVAEPESAALAIVPQEEPTPALQDDAAVDHFGKKSESSTPANGLATLGEDLREVEDQPVENAPLGQKQDEAMLGRLFRQDNRKAGEGINRDLEDLEVGFNLVVPEAEAAAGQEATGDSMGFESLAGGSDLDADGNGRGGANARWRYNPVPGGEVTNGAVVGDPFSESTEAAPPELPDAAASRRLRSGDGTVSRYSLELPSAEAEGAVDRKDAVDGDFLTRMGDQGLVRGDEESAQGGAGGLGGALYENQPMADTATPAGPVGGAVIAESRRQAPAPERDFGVDSVVPAQQGAQGPTAGKTTEEFDALESYYSRKSLAEQPSQGLDFQDKELDAASSHVTGTADFDVPDARAESDLSLDSRPSERWDERDQRLFFEKEESLAKEPDFQPAPPMSVPSPGVLPAGGEADPLAVTGSVRTVEDLDPAAAEVEDLLAEEHFAKEGAAVGRGEGKLVPPGEEPGMIARLANTDETRARKRAEVRQDWESAGMEVGESKDLPSREEAGKLAQPADEYGVLTDRDNGKDQLEGDLALRSLRLDQTASLEAQLQQVEQQIDQLRSVRSVRRDEAVDHALESHDYVESKREYENARAMLQSMKLQHSSKRIGLKIPRKPVVVQEKGKVDKKSRGFLGLGSPTYEGRTTVQVVPITPDLDPFGGTLGEPAEGTKLARQFYDTELAVIEAEQTLQRAAAELDLKNRWNTNEAEAVERLKELVSAEQVEGTDRIEIKVASKDQAEAKEISEKVAEAYQVRREAMEQEHAKKALSALDAELREQEDLVEEKRKVLDTIVQSIGIPYVEGVRGSGEGRSQEQLYGSAERQLYQLEVERDQLKTQVETLTKLEDEEMMKYAAGLSLPQNGVAPLYEKYLESERELARLRASGLGEDHPDVATRRLTTEELKKNLEKSAASLREILKTQLDLIDGRLEKMREAGGRLGTQEEFKALMELKRKLEEQQKAAEEQAGAKAAALKEIEKSAAEEPFSTFSLHVSDVSFKLAQAALEKGEWPEAERVRVEEFVNAFDYGDPSPAPEEKVACQVEQAAHPFMQQRNVMRIAMRTAAVGRAEGTPLRLTILLDNSGSMERADRAEAVRRAFSLLAGQLNPQDEVTLIGFARTPRLLRDGVSGDKAQELLQVIAETPSEGGTNLEEALRLGMEKAVETLQDGAQNRIILLTDGAANLGDADPERLSALVETMRQRGIAFDACGVGADGLNDDILEALTRKGDGRYYFLDRPEDADEGFAKQIAGALRPAAKNVKVQVQFNPKRVGRYALYGFEKHELKKEDFRDDRVDAAELAAEEAGVALYHFETLPDGEGEVGTVSVRFQDMSTGEMVEKLWPIPYQSHPAPLEEAAPSMRLAASAAFLGETLKGTAVGDVVELDRLDSLATGLQSVYPQSERVGQLVEMVGKLRTMGGNR